MTDTPVHSSSRGPRLASCITVAVILLAGSAGNRGRSIAQPTAAPRIAADAPVAIVDGKLIPYSALEEDTQAKMAQLQRDYELQYQQLTLGTARSRAELLESRLEQMVDKRVLALEAQARKTTESALLSAIKPRPVTDAEIHAFYDSQQTQLSQPFEAASPQIKLFLERQADGEAQQQYLQGLRKKYRVSVSLPPLREQIEAEGPARGPDNAVVTLVEFADFQCPYCGRLAPELKELLKEYPTQLRLIFRNNPLVRIHPNAEKAAEAAACANVQGKFWEMHDLLYSEQNSLSVDALKEKARRLGLDSKQFDDCLDSGRGAEFVKKDQEASDKLGLTTTPSSFVNGRFVGGAMAPFKWETLIDEEIRRAGRPVPGA
jgi:protein-disulfide isomerase